MKTDLYFSQSVFYFREVVHTQTHFTVMFICKQALKRFISDPLDFALVDCGAIEHPRFARQGFRFITSQLHLVETKHHSLARENTTT